MFYFKFIIIFRTSLSALFVRLSEYIICIVFIVNVDS